MPLLLLERIGRALQSVYVILGLAAAALRSPKASLPGIGGLLEGCIGIGLALQAMEPAARPKDVPRSPKM